MDGNAASNFTQGYCDIFKQHNYLKYQNSITLKLDDFQGGERVPTSGFTGITITP